MTRRSYAVTLLAVAVSLILITTFWDAVITFLGVKDEASRWYAFDSGSGAIILGDLPLLGGLFVLIRHHNCEIPGCMRIHLKRPTAAGHLLCRKHHPEPGPQSLEEAHAAHRDALAARANA